MTSAGSPHLGPRTGQRSGQGAFRPAPLPPGTLTGPSSDPGQAPSSEAQAVGTTAACRPPPGPHTSGGWTSAKTEQDPQQAQVLGLGGSHPCLEHHLGPVFSTLDPPPVTWTRLLSLGPASSALAQPPHMPRLLTHRPRLLCLGHTSQQAPPPPQAPPPLQAPAQLQLPTGAKLTSNRQKGT